MNMNIVFESVATPQPGRRSKLFPRTAALLYDGNFFCLLLLGSMKREVYGREEKETHTHTNTHTHEKEKKKFKLSKCDQLGFES